MHNESSLFNIRISLYSFILTAAVIWIHAVEPAFDAGSALMSDRSAFVTAELLLGNVLGQLAVPGFFCMSGYLFFRSFGADKGKADLIAAFKHKLIKRIYSLLLPYLLWNLIYYIVYLAAGRAETGFSELFHAVLEYRYNPVFWYLHELILITIITPLIYVLLKHRIALIPVLLLSYAAAVFYEFIPIHYVNEDALLYYSAGAALALHLRAYEDKLEYIGRAGAGCFLIFVICMELTFKTQGSIYMAAIIGARLSGLLALFATVSVAVRSRINLPAYTGYNFFIYAAHYMEIRMYQLLFDALSRRISGTGLFDNDVLSTAVYVCMPVMCITLAVTAGKALSTVCPKLYSCLTGGRSTGRV